MTTNAPATSTRKITVSKDPGPTKEWMDLALARFEKAHGNQASGTPRTDALVQVIDGGHEYCPKDILLPHARQLERELLASQVELAKAQEQIARYAEAEKGMPEEPHGLRIKTGVVSYDYAVVQDYAIRLTDYAIALAADKEMLQAAYESEERMRKKAEAKRDAEHDEFRHQHRTCDAVLREQYSDTLLRLEKAEAERDAAVRDAERYRIVREKHIFALGGCNSPDEVDAVVDAAIKVEGGKHETG